MAFVPLHVKFWISTSAEMQLTNFSGVSQYVAQITVIPGHLSKFKQGIPIVLRKLLNIK